MKTSNYSTVLTVTTDPLSLDTPIIDVMGTITYNSAVINWQEVDNAQGYKLYLENTDDTLVILDDLDVSNVTTYNLTGLYQNTNYQYKVKAYYNLLESAYSVADDFITNDFVILPPTIGANTDLTFDSVRINWTKRSNATSYKVYLENTDTTTVILNGVDIGDIDTYLFDELDPSSNYLWKIKSYNSDVNEDSSYSSNQTFTTKDPIPDVPTMSSSTSVTSSSFVANWSSETFADSYNVYVYTDIDLTSLFVSYTSVLTNSKSVTGLTATTNYYTVVESVNESGVSAKSTYILTTTEINNLQIDSNTLIAWDLNEGSGSSVTSTSPASENGTAQGTSTSLWQTGTPIDTYRIVLNGTDNYIESTDDNTLIEDFTIRLPINFSEDDLVFGYHVLVSKYDTSSLGVSGGVLYIEYDSIAHLLYFGVSDDTSTFGTPKYRTYEVPFTAIADQEHIIQASFMIQDPDNSNLNLFTVCIDGVEVSGTFNETISNISNLFQSNIKYRLGAYKTTSTTYYGRFSAYKFYFDLTYRNEAYALQDAQNIGLA